LNSSSYGYSILDLVELRAGVRLLKIRNPWEYKEWKGD